MRELVSKIVGRYYRYKQVRMWRREVEKEKKGIQSDDTIQCELIGRCLILIPHSDDEWIGCSKIIRSNNEVILCNLNMNGGDNSLLHHERLEEMTRVANENRRSLYTINDNKPEGLNALIADVKPDYIFLPHYIDWHPEHVKAMMTLAEALNDAEIENMSLKVAMYQVSCPIMKGITHALPMSEKEWKQKWEFFKSHYPTQLHVPYQRFALNETINGQYVESFAAEVFCVMDAEKWKNVLKKSVPSEIQANRLKSCLGSIISMRNCIRNEFFMRSDNISMF